jgi:phage gp45-like
MKPSEIARVQAYLRRLLGSEKLHLIAPARAGQTVEVSVDGEVIGTVHRDDEEGEVSYAVTLSVLEEDLPPESAAPAAPAARRR